MLDELIEQECYDKGIKVQKNYFVDDIMDACVIGNIIYESPDLCGYERNSVRAHEIVHYETCPFNLFEADKLTQKKFELIARDKTMERYFPLDTIIELYEYGARSIEDYSDALEISVKFIIECLERYEQKYGPYKIKDGYRINFAHFSVEAVS